MTEVEKMVELINSEWKDIIAKDDGYKDFTILDEPVKFSELMENRDICRVEVHSFWVTGKETPKIGFCGSFEWENNEINSLDGDSYNKDMSIYAYEWWREDLVLFVVVGNDW